ncbi:Uncharacterised protein [Mycobacterium tuberculosis]|nr:Uncharacterised protein [Mycobacterium tuberculosis]
MPSSAGSVSGIARLPGAWFWARKRRFASSGSAPTLEKILAQFVVPIASPMSPGGPQNAVFPPGATSSSWSQMSRYDNMCVTTITTRPASASWRSIIMTW